ncbi:MAG TPA: TIGR03668 family PPOX class F420-dependent oxidoreductase [Lapillicoccus sp.]|uniref:TIGR03668 family PPOX class F420-dependent oxidoreductase n=1 Tax=Lapillicoccus sp. TaxID=1909287 RepID=UPI002F94A929
MSPRVNDAPARFAAARVARLATTTADGSPHLVPVVFALVGETVWTAVDTKPKSTTALRRLDNVRAHPAVSLLVDHYADDWATLWWVRADGVATALDADTARHGLDALVAKYPQYLDDPPPGPVLRVDVTRWVSWSAR